MHKVLALVALLSGCASTEMRTFVGKPIEEAYFAYGSPEHAFQLPDGRRAYQFRWGGGAVVLPGTTSAQATTIGQTTFVTSNATPSMLYESAGCLITFIARESRPGVFVIEDYRVPKQLVC